MVLDRLLGCELKVRSAGLPQPQLVFLKGVVYQGVASFR
jgi:hypothetical protein